MKAEFHDLNTFPVLVIALLATLTAAGCSSGPDIKPRPVSAPQAGAPSAVAAIQMQTSLAAMDGGSWSCDRRRWRLNV
jgi:hypothetical protein